MSLLSEIESILEILLMLSAIAGITQPAPDMPTEGTVTEVIDGDTVKIKNSYKTYTVRFLGVDTPETKGAVHPQEYRNVSESCLRTYAGTAESYVRQELLGKQVKLEYDAVAGERGSYDRLLAEVDYGNKLTINKQLLRSGYARFYEDEDYTPARRNTFESLYNTSVENEKGMWGGCQ